MICDRAERRVGGTSAPVFGGGFLGFPRKAGYLIGGIFISLPQEWLYDRGCRRRLRRSAFCRADPVGQPSPALRLRRLFLGCGVVRPVIFSWGSLSSSRKNGLMTGSADGGCAARLFVGLTLPGSPPPLRGSAAFLGAAGLQGRLSYRGYFSAAKRGRISGAPGPAR